MVSRREQVRQVQAARKRAEELQIQADAAAREVARLRWADADAASLGAAIEHAARSLDAATRANGEALAAIAALYDAIPDGAGLQEWVEGRD
jgi:hypothetical protein